MEHLQISDEYYNFNSNCHQHLIFFALTSGLPFFKYNAISLLPAEIVIGAQRGAQSLMALLT